MDYNNEKSVKLNAIVSNENSTTTILTGEGAFVGTYVDALHFTAISVVVKSDKSGTIYFDYSSDASTLSTPIRVESFSVTGGATGAYYSLTPRARYFRVRYGNGVEAQTSFEIQTILCSYSGNISVNDGGGALTVDGSVSVTGTVTANAGTNLNTSLLATAAKQLPDGHSVSVSNMIPAVETGLATSAKQLPDGHAVTVSNMIPAVETGLATSANQGKWNGAVSGLTTWKEADGKPRVSSMPYLYDIAEGNVSGHTAFAKYGICTGVQQAEMDVWEGNSSYTFPATAGERMRVVSSSANDTSDGTGAQKIKIEYLDDSNATQTEEVTMAGQTPVNTTATKIRRINRVYISQAGTGGKSAGKIDVYHFTEATPIYGIISAGKTQSRQLIYTVPAGKTLYITSIAFSSGVGNTTASGKFNYVTFTMRACVNPSTGAASTIFYPYNEIGLVNAPWYRELEIPTKIPATADLKISVIGDTAQAVSCNAAIRGWLE